MEHLHEGGDGGAVPVAVAGLEVEVGGGAAGALAGLLGGEELGAARALRVEAPLPDPAGLLRAVGLGPGDAAAEVGVRAGEPRGAVGHVGGAAEVTRMEEEGVSSFMAEGKRRDIRLGSTRAEASIRAIKR